MAVAPRVSKGEGLPVPEEARVRVSSTVKEAPEEEAASFLLRKAIRRLLSRFIAEGLFFFFTGTWAGKDLIPVVSKVKQNVPKVRLNEKANPWFPSSLQSSKHLFPMDGKSSSSPGVIAEC